MQCKFTRILDENCIFIMQFTSEPHITFLLIARMLFRAVACNSKYDATTRSYYA